MAKEQRFQDNASKRAIKLLNKTIQAIYEARLENSVPVMYMPVKDLYQHWTSDNVAIVNRAGQIISTGKKKA